MLAGGLDRRAAGRRDRAAATRRRSPTTSARVRSTSIVALTVSSSRSTSQPAADGRAARALERRVRGADQPMVGPRHEEDDLAGHPDGEAHVVRDPCSRHDEMSAATRQDPERCRHERWSGSAAQTPVASTMARVRISRSAPVSRSIADSVSVPTPVPVDRRPLARTRVTATPPAAIAVRATASVYRASSSTPS